MVTALIAMLTFGSCVVIRWYLEREGRKNREYANGLVWLTSLWNEGTAFDLPIPRKAVTAVSGLAMAVLWAYRRLAPVGAGLILGGGVSNLLERLRHGKVFDYVRFPKAPGKLKRYVFNLADFAIFVGALCLLLRKLGKRRG